jgi:hypothetical protein
MLLPDNQRRLATHADLQRHRADPFRQRMMKVVMTIAPTVLFPRRLTPT